MGDYLFFVGCVGLWLAFAWALVARPVVLDRAWHGVRRLPMVVEAVVWVAFLPWLSGLAIWESGWRTPQVRRLAVLAVAGAFIAFWALLTFTGGGEPRSS